MESQKLEEQAEGPGEDLNAASDGSADALSNPLAHSSLPLSEMRRRHLKAKQGRVRRTNHASENNTTFPIILHKQTDADNDDVDAGYAAT